MKSGTNRPEKLAWMAVLAGFLPLVAGFMLAGYSQAKSLIPPVLSSCLLLLFALMAAARLRLLRRQEEEEAAVADYREQHSSAELFEESDEALKLVARANHAFTRYFVPVFTVLAGLLLLGLSIWLWRGWSQALVIPPVRHPLRSAVLALSLFVYGLVIGSYYIGVSREAGCRWLRPCGAWLLATAFLFALAGLALIAVEFKINLLRIDLRTGRIELLLLMAVAVELLLNVIIEAYRPRGAQEEERPQYESKLMALVTEPGSVAGNVAAALDYQFGFRVSEVWFYRFLERTVIPFALFAVFTFWLMSCLIVIKAEENGLRMRFGRLVGQKALTPGLYCKLPWPFEKIQTFPVQRVQEIPIGYLPAGSTEKPPMPDPSLAELQGDLTERVIVWSKIHLQDEINFVVASQTEETESAPPPGVEKALPVSVNFMSASIPLYFKISDLYAYLYKFRDAKKILEEVATREVVRYLANVDFVTSLSSGRAQGGIELRDRIQTAADRVGLGIEVVFVGLQGMHPPVKVGSSFDEVVGAMQMKYEEVLKAETDSITRLTAADANAATKKVDAQIYQNERVSVSMAEAARFEKQMLAFQASPQLYVLYSFLDMLETDGAKARKYIVAVDQSMEVTVINLEKKLRPDLLDLEIQP